MGLEYYVIDTETTGLSTAKHEVIEISILRCSNEKQITKQIRAEHPETASYEALEITGKTHADLDEGEDRETVVRICDEFLNQDGLTPEHRCLVAHNASFDKRFCHALWASVGRVLPANCWLDTIKLTKEWAKKDGVYNKSYKLASSLEFAKITPKMGAHAAAVDVQNTYMLWKKGMESGANHLTAIKRWPHEKE